jgi:23S rRNA (uridine2552-2'-O)-methyltransferase
VGPSGAIVGVDLSLTDSLSGATLIQGDFRDEAIVAAIRAALGGPADLVLSDMAAPATGHAATDHLRVVALAEDAFTLAQTLLRPGGAFVAKVFQGGATGDLLAALKKSFAEVRHAKPAASRAESAETYVVAKGFRGNA